MPLHSDTPASYCNRHSCSVHSVRGPEWRRTFSQLTLGSVCTLVWGFEPKQWVLKHLRVIASQTGLLRRTRTNNAHVQIRFILAHKIFREPQTQTPLTHTNKTPLYSWLHNNNTQVFEHVVMLRLGLPCLSLPLEGSLGKAAEWPAFLGGAENSRPGAALRSIHCLQGQRQKLPPHFS